MLGSVLQFLSVSLSHWLQLTINFNYIKKKKKKEMSVRSTYCRFSLAFLCLVPTPACGNPCRLPPRSQSGFLSCLAGAPIIGLCVISSGADCVLSFAGPPPFPCEASFLGDWLSTAPGPFLWSPPDERLSRIGILSFSGATSSPSNIGLWKEL